jgi:hypothetical protein
VTSDRSPSPRLLSVVAAVSGVYDFAVGVAMVAGRGLLARAFSVPLPDPPIHADLNGLFLIAVALGYVLPYRRPDANRGYLWVMGVLLKGAGALVFLLDHVVRQSPAAYLLFAATDGSLAALTLWALLRTSGRDGRAPAESSTTGPRPR